MSNRVLANPALGIDVHAVAVDAELAGIEGHVLFQTSGSSGAPKWVAISERALEASAAAVNARLGVSGGDLWLRAIPGFHVGGHAIGVRAELAGARVREFEGKWDAAGFVAAAEGATLTSLVPTQVYDLVAAALPAPRSLRVVLVGGGVLPPELRSEALDLGWPLRATYGMTEAGSSVAIGDPSGSLRLLDIWRGRVNDEGELEIAGDALFSRYLSEDRVGEWFATGDRVELDGDGLRVLGRCDSVIKVMGERVDLDALQGLLPAGFAVVAVPDERTGQRLVLVGEAQNGVAVLDSTNRQLAGFERLSEYLQVGVVPRSSLGKVQRALLVAQISENTKEA